MSDTRPVVDVNWLARQPPGAVRVVDLRWALSGPTAVEKYRAGHIPGALYVDMERDLSRPGGPGRHPFPAPEDFARVLSRLGVAPETHVVVYDDATGSVAARLWFMLRVHGHSRRRAGVRASQDHGYERPDDRASLRLAARRRGGGDRKSA